MFLLLALAAVVVLLVIAIVPTRDGSVKNTAERIVESASLQQPEPLKAFSLRQMQLDEESAIVAGAYIDLEQERFRKECVAKAAAMFGTKTTKA